MLMFKIESEKMDPFTQRMLERAKSRREKLDNQKMIFEKRIPLQEKVIQNEKSSSDESSLAEINKGKQYITPLRKSKLQRLAQFYSAENENYSLEEEELDEDKNKPCDLGQKTACKLSRLDDLASKIKQWEEDTSYKRKDFKEESPKEVKTNISQAAWDSSVVDKLCSQGFSRSESQSKLFYNFKTSQEQKGESYSLKESNMNDKVNPETRTKTENAFGSRQEVLRKAAFFESGNKTSPNKAAKDPAELSLAERKALFEKANGKAVIPKNSFGLDKKTAGKPPGTEKRENKANEITEWKWNLSQVAERKNLVEKKSTVDDHSISPKESHAANACEASVSWENRKGSVPEPPPIPVSSRSAQEMSSLGENTKTLDSLCPRSGRLYPSLSSLDITEQSEFSRSHLDSFNESKNNSNLCLNMSLSELLEMSKNNPATPPRDQSFSQSKECQVLNKMDKLLEEALNDFSSESGEDSDGTAPSPPKMKKSSSFEYKSGHDGANPLLHTVSFYRKQQQNSCLVGERTEEDTELEETVPSEDEGILVQNKIHFLITEVSKQQTIISQASQALNLCLSTVEFSGSGEQVEGERLLLLASHKRQACLNEIQRLKVENTLWPQGANSFLSERGDVNLTNVSVKLKRDALRSIAAAENLQYFVCLIKSDEQVLATPAMSATKENLKDMALRFPGQIKLEGLLSSFKITVEVYNLELSKELLPHDVKYHIVNKKEKKLLTPIKGKKSESKLVKPNIQSPAGPNAVRTSNFQLCGYIVFSLKEIARTQWILNKVPYVSPVEGTISMTVHSQLRLNGEFRGFLTMFDDISGFGAWHRRWCLLSSHFISFWKYPDDETRKVPIGTIDLKSVITENVGVVSRDICVRLNTFLLETTRPRLSSDKNSLVMSVKDDVTTIRHLLSADSKQEMATWCKKLNTALALLRSWKCNINE